MFVSNEPHSFVFVQSPLKIQKAEPFYVIDKFPIKLDVFILAEKA